MSNIPYEMLRRGRSPDQVFPPDEELYRAFEKKDFEGAFISLDAIELPDMSVNRSTKGKPEWMLQLDRFRGCGVAYFTVAQIPTPLEHLGVKRYDFRPFHCPTENNYPHSEVRAFEPDGVHIDLKDKLDADLHLRWRRRLRKLIRKKIPAT